MLQTFKIEYAYEGMIFEGYCAFDDSDHNKKPAILIAHDWSGRNEFACKKAEQLAALGYVGFALDMYGKGKIGQTVEEKKALMQPLMDDRNLLKARILAAYETLKKLEVVDTKKMAAIGFCFGGLCVLDLARSGVDLQGVVSFHGLLSASQDVAFSKILSKVLVLHGHDDPMVSLTELTEFQVEMTEAKVDWQLHVYSNTTHGFTNPQAHDVASGIVYNEKSAARSWSEMKIFFSELFA